MRVLVVCPSTAMRRTGSGHRLRISISALKRIGNVEIVALTNEPVGHELAEDTSCAIFPVALLSRSLLPLDYLVAMLGLRPRRLATARFRAQRRILAARIDPTGYELIWAYSERAFLSLPREFLNTATVVDLVDFEAQRDIALVRSADNRFKFARVALARFDARALRRTLRGITKRARITIISSVVDQERLGIPEVEVVPNSYTLELKPEQHLDVSHPVFMLAGALNYQPNLDAANWLVSEIWPLIRLRIPNAELRLVGGGIPIGRFDNVPGTTVVGAVASMAPELRRASAVLVPLRSGSGTRVKILEAWAACIPVVSTTVGAEGLGAEHGRHLLIANDPVGFADAALKVVQDREVANGLVQAGGDLFNVFFSPSVVEDAILKVATRALEITSIHHLGVPQDS